MAKRDMLDETKMILEKMNESEEKVFVLREDLNENNTYCQQITNSLKEMRQLSNKNTTELEDNRHLKNNIKDFNQQLLGFAQIIYHCIQELHSDLKGHDAELGINEELLYKNRVLQQGKIEEYKRMHAELIQQLELLKTEDLERVTKQALESEALIGENCNLEREIKIISQAIECEENYIKNQMSALEDEKESEKLIENLQESVEDIKREIEGFKESLEEVKEHRKKLETEGHCTLSDLNQKISELETEIKEISFDINNCQLSTDEVTGKIEILEAQIMNREEECTNYKHEMDRIEINLKELEEDYKNNMILSEKLVIENEEKCERKKNLSEQIKADICAYKSKIEAQHENVETILKFLVEYKPNTHLNVELEEREERRRQLKTVHQRLKQDYDKRSLELEANLNRDRGEIEAREQTNRKLQEDTNALISELNLSKNELDQLLAEKEQQNRNKEELEDQIQNLDIELVQARNNRKRLAETNIQSSQTSSTSTKEKNRKSRHWDSDSSMEGEDRRFSELVKQKMKIKKVGKTNTHK